MLLCRKGINSVTGCGIICNECYKYLILNKMPPFALNNSMWIGDVPRELEDLSLAEQKLIALVNAFHSFCIMDYISIDYSIVTQVVLLNYLLLHVILLWHKRH